MNKLKTYFIGILVSQGGKLLRVAFLMLCGVLVQNGWMEATKSDAYAERLTGVALTVLAIGAELALTRRRQTNVKALQNQTNEVLVAEGKPPVKVDGWVGKVTGSALDDILTQVAAIQVSDTVEVRKAQPYRGDNCHED